MFDIEADRYKWSMSEKHPLFRASMSRFTNVMGRTYRQPFESKHRSALYTARRDFVMHNSVRKIDEWDAAKIVDFWNEFDSNGVCVHGVGGLWSNDYDF